MQNEKRQQKATADLSRSTDLDSLIVGDRSDLPAEQAGRACSLNLNNAVPHSMKKLTRVSLLTLVATLLGVSTGRSANPTVAINSVTLNSGPSVTVQPGASITAAVT